jgi:hypothetical protein
MTTHHEEMFNIVSHKGNASQNYTEIPPHSSQMVIIKNTSDMKGWWGCGEKETLTHCWWECKLVRPLWKSIWRFLKKLKIEAPYHPAVPHLGQFLKGCRSIYSQDTCTPMILVAQFTIDKMWSQPKCQSTNEWIWKCGIYTPWSNCV